MKKSEEASERNNNTASNNNNNNSDNNSSNNANDSDTSSDSPSSPATPVTLEPVEDPLSLIEVQVALEKLKESSSFQIQQLQDDVTTVSFLSFFMIVRVRVIRSVSDRGE